MRTNILTTLAPAVILLVLLSACGKIGVDKRDAHGMTALMRAAQRGDQAAVERLITRGADVNAQVPTRDLREIIAFLSWMQQLPRSDIGYTALHYAAQGGHLNIVRLLLEQGADIHQSARGGDTAFDLALSRSEVEILRLLTTAGVRANAQQFRRAVSGSSPETVQFLLEQGVDPHPLPPAESPRTGPPPTPLVIIATIRGDPTVLKLLIDRGEDVNARDRNDWSTLRWARRIALQGRWREMEQIIELLEAAGARDEAGARADALFDAVLQRDVTRVRAALRSGADPNAKDDRGVPPLIAAANLGEAEIVAALVDAGADVNASPEHDTTPLIAAITGGNVEAVKKLLTAGAKSDQPDRLRRTPLQAASSWSRSEITSLLLASSAAVDPHALAIAALNGNADQVRLLLARGADPNAGRGHALIEATRGCLRHDNTEVIRLLLDAGADPTTSRDEYSALHRAAGLCAAEVVRLLLERGADPNARDLNGGTPLSNAAASGRLENVRLLLAAHADVNVRGSNGKSILEEAARYPEVQHELRRAGAR